MRDLCQAVHRPQLQPASHDAWLPGGKQYAHDNAVVQSGLATQSLKMPPSSLEFGWTRFVNETCTSRADDKYVMSSAHDNAVVRANRIRRVERGLHIVKLVNCSANYLNLRTVTLAYNLPKSILNVINIKSARVNVSAENLFMLKARQGLNPQANYAGVSYNEYMPAKNFTIGLNVSF